MLNKSSLFFISVNLSVRDRGDPDVCIGLRQILTYKIDPRTERVKIFLMDSNETDRANQDIFDDLN